MKKTGNIVCFIVPVLAAALCASCTSVEMGMAEDMPDSVQVDFSVNWPDGESRPDEAFLVMSRLINTVHYSWNVDADGNIISSYPPQDTGTSDQPLPDIPNGDYYMMIFTAPEEAYTVDSLESFSSSETISMRSLVAKAKKMTDDEIEAEYGEGMPDFNPAYSYIRSGAPIYIDVKKQILSAENDPNVVFDMNTLTQTLTFRIKVLDEADVDLRRFSAEISGVPGSVELMSGRVSRDSTYRVLFNFDEVGVDGEYRLYEGKVNVLGLFPGESADYITGPGILQLSVVAASGEYERTFHAGLNMHDTITSAGLMEVMSDASGYKASRQSADLEVGAVLRITRDQVVAGDDGQGIRIWLEMEEKIDVEI